MKFGLEDRYWQFIESNLILPLKNSGARVYIFGSRVRGDHKKFSDLDVLYEANETQVTQQFVNQLSEQMETSSLPIKIDIVRDSDLASSYRNNVYQERVEI